MRLRQGWQTELLHPLPQWGQQGGGQPELPLHLLRPKMGLQQGWQTGLHPPLLQLLRQGWQTELLLPLPQPY